MAPKFKGDGDDWLDDEKRSSSKGGRHRKKKAPSARSLGIPLDMANATVAEVYPNQCRVKLDQALAGSPEGSGPSEVLCSYRRAEVVSKSTPQGEVRERSPVAVGDRVQANITGSSTGVIEAICERKNSLSRPAPGRDGVKLHHVLAANLDYLVIVASVSEPSFSSGIVDRFLVAAEAEGIPSIICITKIDLLAPQVTKEWEVYRQLGYPVFELCAKQGLGLEPLLEIIQGKAVVFCGHSGVGKTSLLRTLLKSEIGRVGDVNVQTGKGRHTTTGAVLLGGPHQSQWIDTPGVKAFGLAKITPETLASHFLEFRSLKCPVSGCLHLDEEGCLAPSLSRYTSYRRVLESLIAGEF